MPELAAASAGAERPARAVNEFAVLVSGLRPVTPYAELDLLGGGRAGKGQWMTPRRVTAEPGCVSCTMAGAGDAIGLGRYIAE